MPGESASEAFTPTRSADTQDRATAAPTGHAGCKRMLEWG